MPPYDYVCDACGHELEAFEPITAQPRTDCPECAQTRLRRKIGPWAAILFKGSGFYQTDYRSESYKKAAQAEKSAAEPAKLAGETAKPAGDTAKPAGEPAKSGSARGTSSAPPTSPQSEPGKAGATSQEN